MKKYILFLLSVFIFSGCSVVSVSTDFDPSVSIDKFKTYAIVPFEQGDALINNRINVAIQTELSSKSYLLVNADKAEFIVLYRYTSKDKSQTSTQYVGGGMGRYGRYGGFYTTSTYNYTEGNFEIRMANPKTKDTFWRAEGVNTLKSFDTPDERTKYTNEIVHKMLEKYPNIN